MEEETSEREGLVLAGRQLVTSQIVTQGGLAGYPPRLCYSIGHTGLNTSVIFKYVSLSPPSFK